MKWFYEGHFFKSPPHSRIGLIRLINTVVGLCVALKMYKYIKTGHISTHPIENFFGFLRISSNYNHSYQNILLANGKAFYIKKALEKYNIDSPIRTRLSYGGTKATEEKTEGIIPEYSPYNLFLHVYIIMKDPSREETRDFVKWYSVFKTDYWDELISTPGAASGSNIFARYVSQSNIDGGKKRLKFK